MKYLIVGLGNIGNEYQDTRHNIGFTILDALAKDKRSHPDIAETFYVYEFERKCATLLDSKRKN